MEMQNTRRKNAVVVLQLEKASVITGIDIGNEHAAYIEVLVSRSGTDDKYKVFLVTSSFMTPLDARQSQNINKVRMFNKEHLSKPECDEKWDRIKIVCTQPFNKHVQYGLSFINVHTSNEKPAVHVQDHIGKFVLRPSHRLICLREAFFEKRKELVEEERAEKKLTGAAAIREAASTASLAQYGSPVCKPKLKTQSVTPNAKRDSLDDTEKTSKPETEMSCFTIKMTKNPMKKIDKIMEKKAKEKDSIVNKEEEKTPKRNNKKGQPIKDQKTPGREKKRRKRDHSSQSDTHKKPKKDVPRKPFSRLMEDVTLVISGIQNPDRANLRTSALSMGAKYKPVWENGCTHLICAFANTPKFKEVKGKGKIVTKKWIEDCYRQRKRLPWRRYALDKDDIGKDESEDEVYEILKRDTPVAVVDEDSDYGEHKNVGSDTDERIARIREKEQLDKDTISKEEKQSDDLDTDIETPKKRFKGKNSADYNIYDADTDEEERPQESPAPVLKQMGELRNFFTDKKFYLDHSFDDGIFNRLRKYVAAYNGRLIDDPTANIDIIVTSKENSESMKEINSVAVCLTPNWVWECHNRQKLLPIDQYAY
ncbi:hypothetical protein NQ317_003520 [Molorchus minor]|uniref:BRCT domain-containing protein n=1 Tax=Molorchus minor TaxID=1323400 RepID=A0ABQ9K2Q3_9CUCU|nr:hypothetical protein NQ317_003520 [Molorchus minor]